MISHTTHYFYYTCMVISLVPSLFMRTLFGIGDFYIF